MPPLDDRIEWDAAPVSGWGFNLYRLIYDGGCGCVYPLWGRNGIRWTSNPKSKERIGGSQSSDPIYATEAEAWAALDHAFDAWIAGRRGYIQRRGLPTPTSKPAAKKPAKKGAKK